MEYKRIVPTHFIEVWTGPSGKVYNNQIMRIRSIDEILRGTKMFNCKTIAVWKIKIH